MALPMVGQMLYLEVAEGPFAGRYQCRVGDIEKDRILIEIPLAMGTHRPEPFPDEVSMLVFYRGSDGAQCSFNTSVKGRVVRNIPLLKLIKPSLTEIHRMQRREYLRVPLSIPIEILSVNVQTREVHLEKGFTHDISGGGMSYVISSESQVFQNDTVGISFSLPIDGKEVPVQGKARVLRRVDRRSTGNGVFFSVKFFELLEIDRQKIIKYSLKRQLEMKERGWFDQ